MSGVKLKKYLLDTNTIIYALNNNFIFPKHKYLTSVITEIELLSFSELTENDISILNMALSNFENINLTNKIKLETIKIRRNSKIKLPDSIIIATAIIEKATLITSDKQLLNSKLIKTIDLNDLI